MFHERFISFSNGRGILNLVGVPIVADKADFAGVHIAARNLSEDFARVTKGPSSPLKLVTKDYNGFKPEVETAIIVGSIEASSLLQSLEKSGTLQFNNIRGKWESYMTALVEYPFEGCHNALVIAGSDKRGAIFGVYALSEQIGVSPWYWWADVVPQSHTEIYALPLTTMQGEPSVRFRGIFINDEAPALTSWVRENFGKYNIEFYKKVFELLLRLKANFLWPAMWPGYPNPGASFFTDDTDNQKTADEYGICISTSHHEPMQRMSNEWFAENAEGSWNWLTNKEKIVRFFADGVGRAKGHESYLTLGMRGEYDKKMDTDDPAAVVRDVIQTQREIIQEFHGSEDAVLQLLALYKEVQEQYESGRLEVPDDVTLLFADDNFGSLRRLPQGEERKRKGGAGVRVTPNPYRVLIFAYASDTDLLSLRGKTWHQLQEAHRRGARQIWIFNVGDIKPLEIPMTFAMALAWDIYSIKSSDFRGFFSTMAEQEFGLELSKDIGAAWHEYDRLVSLRKHEHVEPYTFSLLNYNEAENILNRWETLLNTAEAIHQRATDEQRPSVFQLILHPIKASTIFVALQVNLGRNQLYARQRRNSANALAQQVLELFDADFNFSEEFHALLNGKWNHMMMQPHYGFGDTWHAPSRDMISGVCYVQRRQNSNPITGQMGIAVEGHEGVRPGRCNEESDRTHPSRRDLVPGVTVGALTRYGPTSRLFDVFTRGNPTIHWTTSVPYDWIRLSVACGTLVPGMDDARVEITIDWDQVSIDFNEEVLIDVHSAEGDFEQVHLLILGRKVPSTFSGFVEADGYICIPAPCGLTPSYRLLPDIGRSSTGSVALNLHEEKHEVSHTTNETHYLTYHAYFFTNTRALELLLYFNMTLDVDPSDPMTYDILIDGITQTQKLVPQSAGNGELPEGWAEAVQDCVWVKKHIFSGHVFEIGAHTIQVKLRHSNMLLEKLVVNLGGMKQSYLGPPPSYHTPIHGH